MKCPKCGSTNISTERRPDGFNTCLKCGYKWQNGVELKLTTAEMLLFITKFCIRIKASIFMTEKLISICKPFRGFEILCTEEIFKLENGFEEAIKQAYDWAKQEEQNA